MAEEEKDLLIFVGSGVSTGIPYLGHTDGSCSVCFDALENPASPNRRNNVSLLIHTRQTKKNILIDCGKTFRDAFLRVLAKKKITHIDSLLLTHDHADAMHGVDDLRDLQTFQYTKTHKAMCKSPTPTYLSQHTFKTLSSQFKYIVDASKLVGKNPDAILPRRVTCLAFSILSDEEIQKFTPPGSEYFGGFSSIPVEHGEGYKSLGFVFGIENRVVYLSDVSQISTDVMDYLKSLPFISILVIDCLLEEGKEHFSHFCIDQMWEVVLSLKPKKTFGVGMFCNLDHFETNKLFASRLSALGPEFSQMESVELAFDGLTLPVHL